MRLTSAGSPTNGCQSMSHSIEVRKTYKYRLYTSRQDVHLRDTINIAGILWNHLTALQKRYYRRFGKHISEARMKRHISHLRMNTVKYAYWRKVGSQAVQEICERHEAAYERFFKKQGGLPRFKKVKKFTSFVLKQAGWKLHPDTHPRGGKKHPKYTGHITIQGIAYKFVKHRPMSGVIKTVTVKRDTAGRLWICFSVVETIVIETETSTGKIGGFDFGLRMFLTTSEGDGIPAPQFYLEDLPHLRQIQRQVSKKVKGSGNQQAGKQHTARRHIRIADKRRDFHFQMAHQLCKRFDVLVFEDLNIAAMKRLWGRKVSDLGFAKFVKIVQGIAIKSGKQVVFIDRFERTTGKCSACGHQQTLMLTDRTFVCQTCGQVLDRDHNAAINIRELGHQLILSQSVEVSRKRASGVYGRCSRL